MSNFSSPEDFKIPSYTSTSLHLPANTIGPRLAAARKQFLRVFVGQAEGASKVFPRFAKRIFLSIGGKGKHG
jgi:hypothetical protein